MTMISFRCRCGADSAPPSLASHPWAHVAALGDFITLVWHESEAGARLAARIGASAGQNVDMPRSQPAVGARHWVSLGDHFAADAEAPFWVLYETPEIFYMGFDEPEARLSDLALLQCRIAGFERTRDAAGVAVATVEAALQVDDLLALTPYRDPVAAGLWGAFQGARNAQVIRQGTLLYFEARDDGWGAWALMHHADGVADLLMLADYGNHDSHVWAGRLRIYEAGTWCVERSPGELAAAIEGDRDFTGPGGS